MSKKTAMMELFEWFEEFYSTDVSREKFNVAIEKEKQQIVDTYNKGYSDGTFETGFDEGSEYYKETYKPD